MDLPVHLKTCLSQMTLCFICGASFSALQPHLINECYLKFKQLEFMRKRRLEFRLERGQMRLGLNLLKITVISLFLLYICHFLFSE